MTVQECIERTLKYSKWYQIWRNSPEGAADQTTEQEFVESMFNGHARMVFFKTLGYPAEAQTVYGIKGIVEGYRLYSDNPDLPEFKFYPVNQCRIKGVY